MQEMVRVCMSPRRCCNDQHVAGLLRRSDVEAHPYMAEDDVPIAAEATTGATLGCMHGGASVVYRVGCLQKRARQSWQVLGRCTKQHGTHVSGVAGPDCESGVPEAVRRGTEQTDGLSVRTFAPDSRYSVRCQAADFRYL